MPTIRLPRLPRLLAGRLTALVVTLVVALVGVLAATTPVQAASAGPDGQVTTRGGLAVRDLPTNASRKKGALRFRKVFPISCKVAATVVDRRGRPNNLWYRLPASSDWVSARYVRNVNGIPSYCGTAQRFTGRVTTTFLRGREAPTTRARARGGFAEGRRVRIICKLQGQRIGGNNLWYNLPRGRWISARYVANVGAVPGYCTD